MTTTMMTTTTRRRRRRKNGEEEGRVTVTPFCRVGVVMMVETVVVVLLCTLMTIPGVDSGVLPRPPRKVRARVVSAHVIKLRWRDPGAKKKASGRVTRFYSVRYSPEGAEDDYQFLQSGDSRVRVGKLHPNTTYLLSVRTVAGKKGSSWSRTVKVTTAPIEHRVVTKLKATPLSSQSIQLTWKLPKLTNETVAYAILWAENDVIDKEQTAMVPNGSASVMMENLRPHRLYRFRVRTVLAEGPGGSTEKAMARTFSDKPSKAPRNVVLKYSNNSYVLVKWRPPTIRQRNGVLEGYKIQYRRKRSRRGDVCTLITKPSDTHYVLTDINGGETYKIRVGAMTVNGTGPFSKWDSVHVPPSNNTQPVGRKYKKKLDEDVRSDDVSSYSNDVTPAAPEDLRASDVRSTAVSITWSQAESPVCCPIVAYRIMTRNINSSEVEGEVVTGPSPEARMSFLRPNTVYGFNISAFSIAGESPPSSELTLHTLPAEPPSILWVHSSPVVAGASANLSCMVRAEPPPEVIWFGPNQTVPYSSGRMTNLLLHGVHGVHVLRLHKSAHDVTTHLLMDRVTPGKSGVYTCSASNVAGTVTSSVTLVVHEAPSVVESKGASVMDSQGTQLMCTVRGVPLPTVVWIREHSDIVFQEQEGEDVENATSPTTPFVTSAIEEEGEVRRSYLHLPRTSLRHHGYYICMARSLAGINETRVLLTVNTPPPPAVQNLRAIALSPLSVSVVWDRPFEYNYTIDGYRVSYRPLLGGQTRYLDTPSQKQDIGGLLPRHQYVIAVTPFNAHALGDTGREVMVMTLTNENLQPANVSAVALNSSMIQLDWASPQNINRMYIRGYNLYYRRENDSQQEMLFIEGNRNKQFLIGLGRDETYYLRIATLTSWGFEATSQWIRIQKHPLELFPPVTPKEVKAVETVDSIRVTWTSSDEPGSKKSPLLGYRMIYGPVDAPSEINRVDLGASATQFTIRGLNASTKYIIALRAFNTYAVSDPVYLRATTKALPPSTVLKATAVALSPTEIHVHWRPPVRGHVTKYQLRYWRPGKRDKQSAWLMAPTTNYVAGSLKAHSQYRFEIIPFNEEVIGEGSVIFADTLPSRPQAPPADVTLTTINATHILLTWKPPPEGKQNGPISAYKIIMKKKGGPRLAKFTVDGVRFNYTFSNLEPTSIYKIRMAAINTNGTGPYTDWMVGRTEKLELRQPDRPTAMIVETTSRSLVVTWSAPRDPLVPVMGYIVGYGRYIPEVYRVILGPRDRRYVIADLKPSTEYIVSVRAFNSIGESFPEYRVIQTLSAPPDIKLEVPVKLKVVPLSPTSVGLNWLDPSLLKRPPPSSPTSSPSSPSSSSSSSFNSSSSGSSIQPTDGRVYLIRYSAISGEKYQYLNTTTTFLNVTGLEVATSYEFAVRTTLQGEQSGWSLPLVQTTQQTAPSTAPGRVTIVASPGASSLVLNWTEPLLPNGHIKEYIIYYTSDPSLDMKRWMIKTSTRKTTMIDDVMPHTSYYFRVQARNDAGYGPLSDTVTYRPPSDSRAAPTNVTVWSLQGNISTAVEVVWLTPSLPMGHITGYMVYYTTGDNQTDSRWMIQKERGLSSLILGLTLNSTYYFKVRARYGASLGPFSEAVPFTTPEEDIVSNSEDSTPIVVNEFTSDAPELDNSSTPLPPPAVVILPMGSNHTHISQAPPLNTIEVSLHMGSNHAHISQAPRPNTTEVSQISPEQVSNGSQPISSQPISTSLEQSSPPMIDNDTSVGGSPLTDTPLGAVQPISDEEELSVNVSQPASSSSSSSSPFPPSTTLPSSTDLPVTSSLPPSPSPTPQWRLFFPGERKGNDKGLG